MSIELFCMINLVVTAEVQINIGFFDNIFCHKMYSTQDTEISYA